MKPEAVPVQFGTLLRKYRAASGLSQEELADRAGLSAAAVGALERGRRRAPYEVTVASLADALELASEERAVFIETAKRTRGRNRHVPLTNFAEGGAVPNFISSFVGRIDELAALREMLSGNRLVTIAGSGGVGKTRIACELLSAIAEPGERRIVYVDLAPITDPDLIIGNIASSLGLDGTESRDLLLTLLGPLHIVLVLDNCEHLIQAVAPLARAILQRCPGVSLLATSRTRLGISGETVYRLPSLAFPSNTDVSVADATRFPALELFVERAKSADPLYDFTAARMSVTADICRSLSGIPLAIELAAARLPLLGLVDIRDRLFERFLLTDGDTSLPERQRTMTSTIAWSHNLLGHMERILMRRLAIFADGFTLRAAELVCAGGALQSHDVALHLTRLVDASLVNANTDQDTARYSFAESTRRFALDRLCEADEYQAIARRHAQWLAEIAARAFVPSGAPRIDTVQEATREFINVRAGIEWCLASDSDDDNVTAGSILGGLRFLWVQSFRRLEIRNLIEKTLSRIDGNQNLWIVADLYRGLIQTLSASEVDDEVLQAATKAFERISDFEALAHMNSHVTALFLDSDRIDKAEAAIVAGYSFISQGNLEGSRAHYALLAAESQTLARLGRFDEGRSKLHLARLVIEGLGEPELELFRLARMVELEVTAGNLPLATRLSLDILRLAPAFAETPSREFITGVTQQKMAVLYGLQGDISRACALVRAPQRNVVDLPHLHYLRWTLQTAATVAALRGQIERGARLLGFIEFSLAAASVRRGLLSQLSCSQCLTTLKSSRADARLQTLFAEGARLTFAQACDEALSLVGPG
jgi:predicted ATPase/DNA-binding XRE family transcriptional regulator